MYQQSYNSESNASDLIMKTNSDIISEIGKFIKHHRVKQNKTQEELAKESGIKRVTIARIENGSNFNIMTFIQLLRHLNILEEVMNTFKVASYISPIAYMKMHGKIPKRIRHSLKNKIKND